MIASISLSQVAAATGGELFGADISFNQVFTDSRKVVDGGLFVALRGENFDGHAYVGNVQQAGALAAVVDSVQELPVDSRSFTQLKVDNTLKALGQIAEQNRKNFEGELVALTGSCGKTTTKEMLASIFSLSKNTLATDGNFNNEIGVPLTLLRLSSEHELGIIEMGAAAIGDIEYLCEFTKPSIALITNAQAAHIEGFGSIEGVAQGKGEIYSSLGKAGVAVINADDNFAELWLDLASHCKRIIRFSIASSDADVWAEEIQSSAMASSFTLCVSGDKHRVNLHVPGVHMVANALAAASVAIAADIPLAQIAQGLASMQPVSGRMQTHELAVIGGRIVDDTYNANPAAVKTAIDALAQFEGARRVLVMGNMAELGDNAKSLHAEIGRYAAGNNIDALYACGEHAAAMADEFGANAAAFAEQNELITALRSSLHQGDQVLVKGSRSAGMEKVVAALIAEFGEKGVANAAVSS